jgi:hypothetical protein
MGLDYKSNVVMGRRVFRFLRDIRSQLVRNIFSTSFKKGNAHWLCGQYFLLDLSLKTVTENGKSLIALEIEVLENRRAQVGAAI